MSRASELPGPWTGEGGARYTANGSAVWNGTRHRFVPSKQTYQNFRYPAQTLSEASGEELDVWIRSPSEGGTEKALSPDAVTWEVQNVISRATVDVFPVVIDVARDEATGMACLVLADPHAVPSPFEGSEGLRRLVTWLEQLPAMLEDLERLGLNAPALRDEDFVFDGSGRWLFLGTDLIGPRSETSQDTDPRQPWARLVCDTLSGANDRSPNPEGWSSASDRDRRRAERLLSEAREIDRVSEPGRACGGLGWGVRRWLSGRG